MTLEWVLEPDVFLVHGFLTQDECRQLIERAEAMHFVDAPVNSYDGEQSVAKEYRSNERIMFDDDILSEKLYTRAKHFLPTEVDSWAPCGFNERWRFYRYRPGQEFKAHFDGSYSRSETEKSLMTFLIYLNEAMIGGETRFVPRDFEGSLTNATWHSVTPRTGSALVFIHHILHEGAQVLEGVKYVLRTDVMFR